MPSGALSQVAVFAVISMASMTKSTNDCQKSFDQVARSDLSFLQFLFMEEKKVRLSLERTVENLGKVMQDLQRTVARLVKETQVDEEETCPMGFSRYTSNCYRVFDVKSSWIEAKMYCRVLGGDLAVIDSNTTHDILKQLIERGPMGVVGYWLDGSDLPYMDHWFWIGKNDKQYQQFVYRNWHPHEPNDNNAYSTCMGMWKTHGWLWHDYPCSDRNQGFICQTTI